MKKLTYFVTLMFAAMLLITSCSKEKNDNPTQNNSYPPWSSLAWQKTVVKSTGDTWVNMASAFPDMTDYININITDGIAVLFRSYHMNNSGSLHSNPNRTFYFESNQYTKNGTDSEKVGTIKFWNNKKDASINGDSSFEFDVYNLSQNEKNSTGSDIKLMVGTSKGYYMKVVAN